MGRKNRRIRDDRMGDFVIPRSDYILNQHADKFGDRRDKRNRDRSNRERNAVNDAKDEQ